MATRKPRREEPQTVTNVGVNINGAYIEVQNVSAKKAGPTLAAILNVFRELQESYPELIPVHPTVGGYTAVPYEDDWDWQDGHRKPGFRVN